MRKLSLIYSIILATHFIPLSSSFGLSQPSTDVASQPQFICQTQQTPPVTVAIIDGQTEILASWYSDYLLEDQSAEQVCQEFAQKLQQRYDKKLPSLLAYEPIQSENRWEVCLVKEVGQKCTEENSELLFSLNDQFHKPADCILQNTQPSECLPKNRTIGSVLSVPGGQGYSPSWLNYFFRNW